MKSYKIITYRLVKNTLQIECWNSIAQKMAANIKMAIPRAKSSLKHHGKEHPHLKTLKIYSEGRVLAYG